MAGEELESVTPRSKTRFPDVFVEALRRALLVVCEGAAIFGEGRVLSPPVTEAVTGR